MLFFHTQKRFLRPPAVAAVETGNLPVADKFIFIIKGKVSTCFSGLNGLKIIAAHGRFPYSV
jgi:hypothetical protein